MVLVAGEVRKGLAGVSGRLSVTSQTLERWWGMGDPIEGWKELG